MTRQLGNFRPGSTIVFDFNTIGPDGAPITLSGTPTVAAYMDCGTTALSATLSVDYGSVTGLHHVSIDTSALVASYPAGHDYSVRVTAGTVDGVSQVGIVLAHFSIDNRIADMQF